jgi:hypothetical protein
MKGAAIFVLALVITMINKQIIATTAGADFPAHVSNSFQFVVRVPLSARECVTLYGDDNFSWALAPLTKI